MQKFYWVVLLILSSFSSFGQTFEVDTLLKNGPLTERINLVFLGDGYTASEQGQFINDVNGILNTLFSQSPFKHYKNYFNAFAIKVISEESGANHPGTSPDSDCAGVPQKTVNNYFGSTFDNGSIHRLLYPTKLTTITGVLASNFPMYDQVFVAVNTPYYGGAGGFVATCSSHVLGRDVAIHELGHSFAGLADEYWAGLQYAQEKPNMTRETNATLVKWKNWMGVSDIGIYPHTGDASWQKPHEKCKMSTLDKPLCMVCAERFVERFHELVKPLEDYSPKELSIRINDEDNPDVEFALSLTEPDPSTLKITWENNDVEFADQEDHVSVSLGTLVTPAIIRATVIDTTALSRSDLHNTIHAYVVEWKVERESDIVTGVEITSSEKKYEVQVFSNPVDTELNFSFKVSDPTKVSVVLLDTSGKKIRSLVADTSTLTGEHSYSFTKESLGLSTSSTYLLRFSFDGTIIIRKIAVR